MNMNVLYDPYDLVRITDAENAAEAARSKADRFSDGVQDGKMTQRVVVCPSCKRNTSSKRTRCIYCGTALPSPGLFDAR